MRRVRDVDAAERHSAARRCPEADERLDELALTVAVDAGHADDLAAVHRERHVVEDGAHLLDHGEPETSSTTLSVTVDSRVSGLGSSLPTISSASSRAVTSSGSTEATVRPARITVIASATLSTSSSLWLMKMTVTPSAVELAQRLEQLVDLLRHEHGGGLVEDEDARAAVEHLHDLDALAVADAELGDERVRLDRQAVDLAELGDPLLRRIEVEPDRRARLLAEHDVLGDGEVVGQHEVLVHHADADGDRITRAT